MLNKKTGSVYVVATPIGNLQDISLRAIEVLKGVDRIAAEDTRHSSQLLKHFSIEKPSFSLHEFNERERLDTILRYLEQGESIALISDAGTPLISDPGFHLVSALKAKNIPVLPVPGACAAIAALSVSGLPTDKFIFEGFLPAKEEAKCKRLKLLLHEARTLIFYEAPHRLLSTLTIMQQVFGEKRTAVVARELTKHYESVLSGEFSLLLQHYLNHEEEQRGEIVILVAGAAYAEIQKKEVIPEQVLDILLTELPLKQAAHLASKITGQAKNELYALALAKKNNQN
jgi:16S rRNA (cytidine1402-2'-O)-methyltransferase